MLNSNTNRRCHEFWFEKVESWQEARVAGEESDNTVFASIMKSSQYKNIKEMGPIENTSWPGSVPKSKSDFLVRVTPPTMLL